MNTPKLNGIINHILTLVGGILVAIGIISDDQFSMGVTVIMDAVGAVLALWGFIRSFTAPEKNVTEHEYQAMKIGLSQSQYQALKKAA